MPPPRGAPGNAPDSYARNACIAVTVPSRLAPILTVDLLAAPGPAQRNTSSRVMRILTGRPDSFDSINAMASRYTAVLPPKPPPISVAITFSLSTSMSIWSARLSRMLKLPCVVVQMVDWAPSS